jgi:hypothetical protein
MNRILDIAVKIGDQFQHAEDGTTEIGPIALLRGQRN